MPRGKQEGGKNARGGDRGGKWEGGGGGLSRKQKEAVDALVAAQEKEDKRKEEKRIRRIARQEARRTSSSDSDFEHHHKRKESKHSRKKHSKHHPSSATSSSDSDSEGEERRRRQAEKKARQRNKSKTKKEGKIAEARLALEQVAELKRIIEEKEAAEEAAKASAAAGQMPPPEPKYSIEEVKQILELSRSRAKERTPEAAHKPARTSTKPRTLFEAITCSCDVVVSPLPKSGASATTIASSITSLLEEKLKLAEESQSLTLGMGSTSECRAECNRIADKVAKHYQSLEEVSALKAVMTKYIDSTCKQSRTILSKILEGIATRGIEITGAELHIE